MKQTINNDGNNSLEDIQQAKLLLKKRIKIRERDLEERWHSLPEETFKATTGLFIPAFINNKIAGRSWNLIKDGLGILSPFTTNKIDFWKDAAKQIGLIELLRMGVGLFKKKQPSSGLGK
jgi:hypothetical protein